MNAVVQEQDLSPEAEVEPPPAVVPPANIAGDDLDVAALARERRAERAAARAAKRRSALQQTPQASIEPLGKGPSIAIVQHQELAEAAVTPSHHPTVESNLRTSQPGGGCLHPYDQQQQQQQPSVSGATADGLAMTAIGQSSGREVSPAEHPPSHPLHQKLSGLQLQERSLLGPQQPMQVPLGRITRSGFQHTHHSCPVGAETAQPQAGEEVGAGDDFGQADIGGNGVAQIGASASGGNGEAALAVGSEDNSPAAQDAAARNIWEHLRAGLAQGRGSVLGSAPWRAMQSLPRALPKVLPQPWAPANDATAAPTGQQTLQQRMAADITAMQWHPTAAQVLPDPPPVHAAPVADATSSGAVPGVKEQAEPATAAPSVQQASAAATTTQPQSAPPGGLREADASGEAAGENASQAERQTLQTDSQHPSAAHQVAADAAQNPSSPGGRWGGRSSGESWRDPSRMRTSRVGPERCSFTERLCCVCPSSRTIAAAVCTWALTCSHDREWKTVHKSVPESAAWCVFAGSTAELGARAA